MPWSGVRCFFAVLVLLGIPSVGRASRVRVFDTDNGLPHNRVNRIYLDSRSFLWIATDDGLARFDGHQMAAYTRADGLPHKYVNDILESRRGEYWIATDGGISRFTAKAATARFVTFTPPGPEDARHVNALLEEPDGNLLVGTSGGLFRLEVHANPPSYRRVGFERLPLPRAVMVNALASDARGAVWLATNDGLYRRESDTVWEHFGTSSGLPRDRGARAFVHSFARDGEGRLWAAFKGGFGRISLQPRPGSPVLDFAQGQQPGLSREVRALWFGKDGRRWVATESGLSQWSIGTDGRVRFRPHDIERQIAHEAFLSLAEDPAGNLWIGTRRSGLVEAGSALFETYGADEGLQLHMDQLLLETWNDQLCVFDAGGEQTTPYCRDSERQFRATGPSLPRPRISGPAIAFEDRRAAVWRPASRGLLRYSRPGSPPDLRLLPDSAVAGVAEDARGDLWISHWPAGAPAGLARWERRTGLVRDESHRLPPGAEQAITAFGLDRTGTLWISMEHPKARLFRLAGGRFEPLELDWRGRVSQLFTDSKGRLWITSPESGLGVIDDPGAAGARMRRFTRAEGLSADEVWCVTEDQLGRIYAGTSKGVDRLDPATGKVVHYSAADGLAPGDIRSALRDRKGDLWFVSSHGLSRLNPNAGYTTSARARITGVRIAGVALPVSEFGESAIAGLKFSTEQRSLQIDFAAADYRSQAPARFQFRLDRRGSGGDRWEDPGAAATVNLVDLAPGTFEFKVRALAPDGAPGEPASLTFSVLQPYWRTWWFQGACAIAIVAFPWWMRSRRLKQQLALERVRSRIAMDLHDDIGAGLARISILGEALKSRLGARDGDAEKMLDDIAVSSRQLVADMGDIVWSLDPRRDRVGDLASRLRAFGADLLETRGVNWSVEEPADSLERTLPPTLKRQFYLVFREGIHNVAKHSGARKAILRFSIEHGSMLGELTDDGSWANSAIRNGSGIPSMMERVKRFGGTFEINTNGGGGTSIRVSIPLTQ